MTEGAGLLTREENIYTSSYKNLRAIRVMAENETQFGEFLVATRTPILELNSSYGVSRLRDVTTTTGSGSVADGTGTIDVSTGTTASSTARLDSAEVGRYMPGYGAQIGIGVLLETDREGRHGHEGLSGELEPRQTGRHGAVRVHARSDSGRDFPD